jgi:hypothetical protein
MGRSGGQNRRLSLSRSRSEATRLKKELVASAVMPIEEKDYYQDLERKHFGDQAAGSRFLKGDLKSLLDSNPKLLSETDDRDKFISAGVPKEALLNDRKYFMIEAEGEEGMIDCNELGDDSQVKIEKMKSGSLSFTTTGNYQKTNLATVIIGNYPKDKTRKALITLFPGLPTDPARSSITEENDLGLKDGDVLSLKELKEKVGRDDLLLQVKN